MSLPREALGARLRPLLSETEGRGCVELLTLAGLPSGRGYAQTAAVALNELVSKGLARREKSYGHGPQFFAVPAPAAASEERVGLPELDAILVFKTTIGRPFGAPSDRTTVTCTALLGPSWPAGTRVPPWSTGLFASQVAAGGLGAAKANGTARLRAALSALRADPTRDLSPTPPGVPVSDNETISALLAYCAGVSGGAKDSSVHSWLKARRVSLIRAEELLEQLVSEGRLQLVEKPIAGGEVVLRYLPSGAVEPAPLPRSDAPPEEPHPPAPIEEPVLVAGVPEPCQGCEDLQWEMRKLREENNGAVALRDHLALARQRCAELEARTAKTDQGLREIKAEAEVYYETICGLVPDLRGTSPAHLAGGLKDLVRDLRQERDELALRLDRTEDHRYYLALLAGLDGGAEWSAVRPAIARALQEASTPRPAFDAATISRYLLELPADRWEVIAEARADLAKGKALQEQGERKIADARARLEGLLDTPAGAQAPVPAPELVPDPIHLGGPIPAPPPSGEQANASREPDRKSVVGKALAWLRKREQGTPGDLAAALKIAKPYANTTLVTLTNRGLAERIAQGVYRAREQGREEP